MLTHSSVLCHNPPGESPPLPVDPTPGVRDSFGGAFRTPSESEWAPHSEAAERPRRSLTLAVLKLIWDRPAETVTDPVPAWGWGAWRPMPRLIECSLYCNAVDSYYLVLA